MNKILLVLVLLSQIGCNDKDSLVLEEIHINKEELAAKTIELDTIEAHKNEGVYFVSIITNGSMGRFSVDYGVVKKDKANKDVIYKIEKNKDEAIVVSKEYLSLVKLAKNSRGWFYRQNGATLDTLPGMKNILDSIKFSEGNTQLYIGEANGDIFLNRNSKRIRSINYGNIITGNKLTDFDNLDYKLYKLNGDSLVAISANGNDLTQQKDGLFFIPKPGNAMIFNYNKNEIINVLDSIFKLASHPSVIKFTPIQ